MLPTTIQGVLDQLDQIILDTGNQQSPLAYFAILYRDVTAKVQEQIINGGFEDGPRMEKLDVIFANRYLHAYQQFHAGQQPSQSWQIAFESQQQEGLLILQHLLLGMNAHIDLDLGIAAASVSSGNQIHDLKNDFNTINEILFSLVESIQDRISTVSPLLGLLDRFGGSKDERLATFGLSKTRDHAWRLACLLAPIPSQAWPPIIETTDQATALLAKWIRRPKTRISRGIIRVIKRLESKDIQQNIDALKADRIIV